MDGMPQGARGQRRRRSERYLEQSAPTSEPVQLAAPSSLPHPAAQAGAARQTTRRMQRFQQPAQEEPAAQPQQTPRQDQPVRRVTKAAYTPRQAQPQPAQPVEREPQQRAVSPARQPQQPQPSQAQQAEWMQQRATYQPQRPAESAQQQTMYQPQQAQPAERMPQRSPYAAPQAQQPVPAMPSQQPLQPAHPVQRPQQAPGRMPQPAAGNPAYPQQQTPAMVMNGYPALAGVPQQSYGWEGAGQSAFFAQQQGQNPWQQPYYGQQPYGQGAQTPGVSDGMPGDDPQPMPMPQRGGPSYGGDGTDGHRPWRFPWHLVILGFVLVALVVGGVYGSRAAMRRHQTQTYVSAYDEKFCQGVYVDGIHLGGMTQEEGINAVTAQAQQRNNDWYVRLTYQGQTVVEMNASQLGMRVDVLDVLRQAWEQGHTSSDIYERQEAMRQLMEEPYYAYTAMPSGDTSVVDGVLSELSARVYRAPQDAAIIEFDPSKTYPFTFQEEVPGRMLDTEALRTRIYEMVSTMESGDLEIVPTEIAPSVTVAELQQTVALRADEYTEISTSSTEDRNKNITRAFQLISGTIIPPGGTFSFNGIVGKRTIENGFYPATEYAYGEETEGIGGGVCQASTTIYLAAVAANLKITKHTPHSMAVRYTTYGKDATVNMDGKQIDFCFQNNTDSDIYIAAAVQTAPNSSKRWICRVRIYGMSLGEGVSYKLEAEEVETIPRPVEPEYRKDTKGKYADKITYTDEEYMASEGRDGHITESYCVKYVNGKEESRTFLFRDVYNAAAPVIYRGTQERPLY